MLHSDFNFDTEKVALQFSGGKDSLACLFLMKPHWHQLTVYFTNTGAAFPETELLVERVKDIVPNFQEIKTDQPLNLKESGFPVDVLPIRSAPQMQPLYTKDRVKLQSFFGCCYKNIMEPMQERMVADGITLIIRGQRNDETHQSPLRSGDFCENMKFYFPIQEWTSEQVREYVNKQEIKLPKHYEDMDTSLDCWNCTAYLEDNLGKMKYMKKNHPQRFKVVNATLMVIAREVWRDMENVRKAIEV